MTARRVMQPANLAGRSISCGFGRLPRLAAVGLLCGTLLALQPARAQTLEPCAAIAETAQRMACYDAVARRFRPQAADERRGFASGLQRILADRDVDLEIYALEREPRQWQSADDFKKYPRIVFIGPIDRPLVRRAITDWQILLRARDMGFASVEFADREREVRWLFDVSGEQLPSCDISSSICL
jgi:hypothetical protein